MNNLSLLEAELGRYDEALVWASRGFRLIPNRDFASYHVGIPLVALGDDAVSEQWLGKSGAAFPCFSPDQDRTGDAGVSAGKRS